MGAVGALVVALVAWPSAPPASAAVSAGTYVVTNGGSGQCLDSGGGASGSQLQQASCGGSASQRWTLAAVSGGFRITSAAGLCAGVRDDSTSAGKVVEQVACGSTGSQTWTLVESGGNHRVVNANGGKCLNTKDNSTASGAPVQTNSCDGAATKQWSFTTSGGGDPTTTTTTPGGGGPTTTTTTTPPPGGGTGDGPWPSDTGSVHQTTTKNAGTFFDGGLKRYYGIGDGGQGESQDPMFVVANGGTIQNVIIDAPAGDGIHCEGSCTIRNVWWNDVGEDAATFKSASSSATYLVDGGGAKSGADKVFQHNGAGTLTIRNFQVHSSGKLYRACGNCSTSYQRHVVLDGVTARSTKVLVGINTNWGDTARFSRVTVHGSTTVCEKYQGVPKGSEPKKIGEGADGKNCLYQPSDITQR